MASRTKGIERKLGFYAFSAFQKSFLKKSPEEADDRGARLGTLLFRLDRKHRSRALSNLALAYPEMPENERRNLARRCFQHFGRVFGDFLRSPQRTNDEVIRSCPVAGIEILDEALAAGKGVILITAHYGNWERASHAIAALGYQLSVVVRDANDGDLNQAVLKIREGQGVKVLSRGSAARGILSKLKNNEMVGVLPDQNSGDLFIPFFGKPAGTVTGVSAIHLKTGAPILPFCCRWLSPGCYQAEIQPAIEAVPGFEPLEGVTRAINNSLEAMIRVAPEQWLWFHDRWKSARRAGLLDGQAS